MRKKPVMLMILDGWGIAPPGPTNAATTAKTPNLDYYFAHYPHSQLLCSGEAVGLPDGQMGNSEVGHMSIGSGRIIYQSLARISHAIADGSIEKNKVLLTAMSQAKHGHTLHLLGLLSDGGVHSHIDHLIGLLTMAKHQGVQDVCIHAFLDGRDTPPKSAGEYIKKIEKVCQRLGIGRIATVSGRYYAMDRDKRWERIHKVYDIMTGPDGEVFSSAQEGLEDAYFEGQTDEFVVPFKVGSAAPSVKRGDALICFNFRQDRSRELTHVFTDLLFTPFQRRMSASPVYYVCMTEYETNIQAPIAFPPEDVHDTLAETVSKAGLRQLHIAETEKYVHVTFFFNGGRDWPFDGEERILVPSPKVATYDLQPEMSAYIVTHKLQQALALDKYDLIILNFANPDMVGHTGSMSAAVAAMEAVDKCAGSILKTVLAKGGVAIVTADHGNLEEMEDPVTHIPLTSHTTNPVPFLVIGANPDLTVEDGGLADISPTLLDLMELEKPAAMTGHSLLVPRGEEHAND